MTKKRNPISQEMTFGIGVPTDILGNQLPYPPENRALPSQFSFITMPMNCTFIKNMENISEPKSVH